MEFKNYIYERFINFIDFECWGTFSKLIEICSNFKVLNCILFKASKVKSSCRRCCLLIEQFKSSLKFMFQLIVKLDRFFLSKTKFNFDRTKKLFIPLHCLKHLRIYKVDRGFSKTSNGFGDNVIPSNPIRSGNSFPGGMCISNE